MFKSTLSHVCMYHCTVASKILLILVLSTRQIGNLKNPRDVRKSQSPKCRSQRRVGERKNCTANRQGLFQAMSRLSINFTPDNFSNQAKKKLTEQTKTPSPK